MKTAVSGPLTLTDDEFLAVAFRLGIGELPAVLAVHQRHSVIDRRDEALACATRELKCRNVIISGTVHPQYELALQVLHHPDRELAVRLVTPEGNVRVCLARRGPLSVLARRCAGRTSLRIIGDETSDLSEVVSALLAELPRAAPADIEPVGAPLSEMTESLSDTHDAVALADRIRLMGAESHAAQLLGRALASRQAFAEIVYYALANDEGRVVRGPAAVALFYTKRGRIVAVPSASPAGQLWTTLKAGSDHAIGQAISQLVELADEGWGAD